MNPSYVIFLVAMVILISTTFTFVCLSIKQNKHVKEQKENNTEKQEMLDLMTKVMGDEFQKYSYLVGYYTMTKQKLNSTTFYYFPYILAFTKEELIIFPFIKEKGHLYVRNRMDVDWPNTEFRYKMRKKGLTLTIKYFGEKMSINVDPIIKGTGVEKSDRPLCVFQEAEYEKFVAYLPDYIGMSTKA